MSDVITAADFTAAASESASTESAESTSTESTTTESVASDATTSTETSGVTPDAEADAPSTEGTANTAVSTTKEPPRERWDTILENARRKAREEVEAQYKDVSWVKDVDKTELETTRAWLELGNRNPMLALDQLLNGIIQSNPNAKEQVKRYVEQMFAGQSQGQQSEQDADPMPEPDVPTDQSNGQPVVYSAQRMRELLAWQQRQLTQQFQSTLEQQVGPIQRERHQAAVKQQVEAYSQQAISAVKDLPGFAENKAEIKTVYAAMTAKDGRTEGEKLRDAYLAVVSKKLVQQGKHQAVADIQRKAGATTINPASTSSGQPFDHANATWEESLKYEWEKRKGQ